MSVWHDLWHAVFHGNRYQRKVYFMCEYFTICDRCPR